MGAEPQVEASASMAQPNPAPQSQARPAVGGKFFWRNGEKLYLRGVTYGPFHPDADGSQYHTPELVARDFSLMAATRVNAVRVYAVPPRWLLDIADERGLLVLAGLPWEQHIAFLDDRGRAREIEQSVRNGMRSVAGHPALLGVTIGNEIPASIVRWHGARRIERFLRRLHEAVKSEDPGALVTYVSFPTTEYLDASFLDFACFNVYLETEERLGAYLARLQNLVAEKPLVMAELGLDSLRHGLAKQAATLDWQVRTAFARGAAGAFVFAWTDEWHRGGHDIEDWDFGLTTRAREPKPSLDAVREAFGTVPIADGDGWPMISVVLCSHNGSRTIAETLDHLGRLPYPNFETIVVSDGSTDRTASIARSYTGVRVIETPSAGLSAARNVGLRAARGEIIAYIDDDAYPDGHWLHYLAHAFRTTNHAAIGGPNLPPPSDGPVAECVALAPGGPNHVLLTDDIAEHIPGCNFAVRKSALDAIGGFDPTYRAAGDDVDACWRLHQRGWTIGFHPAAVVWHHRRNSVRAYLRQQAGYGAAEALLARAWPEKYNKLGHVSWFGRIYTAGGPLVPGWSRPRVYQGVWGQAPFQRLCQSPVGMFESVCQTPEWWLIVNLGLLMGLLGIFWKPLLVPGSLAVFALLLRLLQVAVAVSRIRPVGGGKGSTLRFRALSALLHLLQPAARLWGRLRHGLSPRRLEGLGAVSLPRGRVVSLWSEKWHSAQEWLASLEGQFRARGALVRRGGDYESWDLEIRQGNCAGVRLQLGIEEHGDGRQLLRFRLRPRLSGRAVGDAMALAMLATVASVDGHLRLAVLFAVGMAIPTALAVRDWMTAFGVVRRSFEDLATVHGLAPLSAQPVTVEPESASRRLTQVQEGVSLPDHSSVPP